MDKIKILSTEVPDPEEDKMFTGIIEDIGKVKNVTRKGRITQLGITSRKISKGLNLGASVSVDGVCLTAVKVKNSTLTFELQNETLRCSALGALRKDSVVNLERALALKGRFDGHIVQGHVDAVGKLLSLKQLGDDVILKVSTPKKWIPFIVPKGSIAVKGVSLTVVQVDSKSFTVHLIPHTLQETTFRECQIGDKTNLEVDILAKYINQLLSAREKNGRT